MADFYKSPHIHLPWAISSATVNTSGSETICNSLEWDKNISSVIKKAAHHAVHNPGCFLHIASESFYMPAVLLFHLL